LVAREERVAALFDQSCGLSGLNTGGLFLLL